MSAWNRKPVADKCLKALFVIIVYTTIIITMQPNGSAAPEAETLWSKADLAVETVPLCTGVTDLVRNAIVPRFAASRRKERSETLRLLGIYR